MIKAIKFHTQTTICLYFLVYLVRVFICWNFMNPFDWIINMPKYAYDTRAMILFFFCFYHAVGIIAWNDAVKEYNKKHI